MRPRSCACRSWLPCLDRSRARRLNTFLRRHFSGSSPGKARPLASTPRSTSIFATRSRSARLPAPARPSPSRAAASANAAAARKRPSSRARSFPRRPPRWRRSIPSTAVSSISDVPLWTALSAFELDRPLLGMVGRGSGKLTLRIEAHARSCGTAPRDGTYACCAIRRCRRCGTCCRASRRCAFARDAAVTGMRYCRPISRASV